MKIGIYSPYLDAVGGGEKYMLTIGEYLSKEHQVDLLLDSHLQTLNIPEILAKMSRLHNLSLDKINVIPALISKESGVIKKSLFLMKYDWFFFNSDGSLFYSTAKNSVVHFQIPFKELALSGLKGKLKARSWNLAIYNSQFTRDAIERSLKIRGRVIYPPVNVEDFHPSPHKKKQIITVGRLVGSGVKKQDIMIEAFKQLARDPKLKDWSFHIAGAADIGDRDFIEDLKKQSNGFPIYFHINLDFQKLVNLYSESAIYWHAMGFGSDDPKKMEHFGISTVEAMASGCVPIVINKGGQKEIVEDGISGFLWDTIDQLQDLTIRVIADQTLFKKIAEVAKIKSQDFSKKKFAQNIKKIIDGNR